MQQETIQYIALDKFTCEPQVRLKLNIKMVEQIAASFTSIGQLQPIRARWDDGRLVVVDGHHRLAAGKLAGWQTMASIIEAKPLGAGEIIQRQLVANCLREALLPSETGRAISLLMQQTGWTAAETADHLGFSTPKVCKLLAILTLPPEMIAQIDAGQIPVSAGYELTKVPEASDQRLLADKIIKGELTRDGVRSAGNATVNAAKANSGQATRVTAMLGADRSVIVSGPALSLDTLIAWLEELLVKARKARPQGLELGTFIRTLKDQARG
jgi:ParB/RepB/Spo0J family partition protein